MKKTLITIFASIALSPAMPVVAQQGNTAHSTLPIIASEAPATYAPAPTAYESADTGKATKSKYVMDAKPDPIGVKKAKKNNGAFDRVNFKMMVGIANPMGGKDAPFEHGYYAGISVIGRAFNKKGAFEFMWGTDILGGSKVWGARSVGVPIDSVKSFASGGFDMFTQCNFYYTVLNHKKVAVFGGVSLAGVWGILPDLQTTVAGAFNTFESVLLLSTGPKVSAMIGGHLMLDAEYVIGIPGSHTNKNNATWVKTTIPMNTNMTRVGIGFRL